MIEIACGIIVTISIYLILDTTHYRKIFGVVLFSTAINIILLFAGRKSEKVPAFIGIASKNSLSNPVPQALILTAIVIGFGILVYLCILYKAIKNR